MYPEYQQWKAWQQEQEQQEQEESQRAPQHDTRESTRLPMHLEHHADADVAHSTASAPDHQHSAQDPAINPNTRNTTGSIGPSTLSPMFACTIRVPHNLGTSFTLMGILCQDANGTPYAQPLHAGAMGTGSASSGSALPAFYSFSRSAHNVSNAPMANAPNLQPLPPSNYPIGTTWTKF
jgi:hypothetical protein